MSVVGNVSGAIGSFTLTNKGGDQLVINDKGTFTFNTLLPDNAAYLCVDLLRSPNRSPVRGPEHTPFISCCNSLG